MHSDSTARSTSEPRPGLRTCDFTGCNRSVEWGVDHPADRANGAVRQAPASNNASRAAVNGKASARSAGVTVDLAGGGRARLLPGRPPSCGKCGLPTLRAEGGGTQLLLNLFAEGDAYTEHACHPEVLPIATAAAPKPEPRVQVLRPRMRPPWMRAGARLRPSPCTMTRSYRFEVRGGARD